MRYAAARPMLSAAAIWGISIVVGVTVVLGANSGLPLWVAIPTLLWLATVGLPTTLGVILVASFWGIVPGLSGLSAFLCSAAFTGLVMQTLFHACLARSSASRNSLNP